MTNMSRLDQTPKTTRPNKGLSRFLTFLIFCCAFFGIGGIILNQTVLKESFTQEQLNQPKTLKLVTNEFNTVLLDAAQKMAYRNRFKSNCSQLQTLKRI